MTKLNIGIIGAGMIAQEHIRNIQKIKHARVGRLVGGSGYKAPGIRS